MSKEILDLVIVGAGISGIGTAYWLQKKCPTKKFTILEARESIGGTWSLFRYPGIRSDSDMYTFGFKFKPWNNPQALSSGKDILKYLDETVQENDIQKHIQFQHRLKEARWQDKTKTWALQVENNNEIIELECKALSMCSGYYSYQKAYKPTFVGEEKYKGKIIIPQFWPDNYDYTNKKVLIVGSGATAVTLVPAMAQQGAAHVCMLQRSPSYIFSIPNSNPLFIFLRKVLPATWSYKIIRSFLLVMAVFFYGFSKKYPKAAKSFLIKKAAEQLPPNYDVQKHFTPKYNPWEQRVCAVPDGDLFKAIRSGKASVVTDEIAQFTEKGIKLISGEELEADVIVLATGLQVNLMGDVAIYLNNKLLNIHEHHVYKGMMLNNVPNFMYAFGYTNASWTLKVDLTANFFCKILNYMDKNKFDVFVPNAQDIPSDDSYVLLSSGYIQRALNILPKQGKNLPWRVYQNYFVDRFIMKYGSLKDGILKFTK